MIQAKVEQAERPKRPRLYIFIDDNRGESWCAGNPRVVQRDALRSWEECGGDSRLPTLVVIPGEDEVLTEAKVREIAKAFIVRSAGETYSDEVDPFVAFARELGVIE